MRLIAELARPYIRYSRYFQFSHGESTKIMVKIPSRLEDLLPLGAFERVMDALHRPELSQRVREAISKVGLKEVNPLDQVQEAWQQARSWLGTLMEGDPRVSSQMINATGALFRDDSDVLPLASAVSLSFARSAAGFFDRQHCLNRAAEIVPRCLGAKHHLWLSEPLLAVHVAVKALAPGGVLIPRADCVRIPGLGELHAALTCFGNSVTEVGAANGASLQDWHSTLQDAPGKAIVTTSLNGMSARASKASRDWLMEAAKQHGNPVIELLVDGSTDRQTCQQYGLPLASEQVVHAGHVILLPTHLLLGGVRGVICLGDETAIVAMQRMGSMLGAELNGPGVAANLLALQMACLEDDLERGMVGMLRANVDNLRNRCQRLTVQVAGAGPIVSAEVVDSQHPMGPSPWDRYTLVNPVVHLRLSGNTTAIRERLALGSHEVPAVELKQDADLLSVDLRFVHPDDDHRVVLALRSLAD